jgi:hypothetical protein
MDLRKIFASSIAFSTGIYLAAACSGSEPSLLTSSGGSSGMGNSSSGSTTSGGMPGTDASLSPVPDATTPQTDAGLLTDGSAGPDGAMGMDASAMPDAGDQDKNRVQCGDSVTGMYCATGVTCCATHPIASPVYDTFACGGVCVGATSTKLSCDDQNDCSGGQVCCARYTGGGLGGPKIYLQSTCMAATDCSIASSTSGGTQFCDLAGIAGECKGARTCKKDAIFVGYGTCQL